MDAITDYKIIETIRKTNYAQVYKVRKDRRFYILKIAAEANSELNALISREFQILSCFKHKNIVRVFDYSVLPDKRTYFTAEFIKGVPINQYLKGYSIEFINAFLQILDALIQLHNRDYFHGDLKPEHILYVPPKRKAVLIDFGFASLRTDWQDPRGTYFYMAPEVIKGIGINQQSDLYSLGVIMYEILSSKQKLNLKYKLQRLKVNKTSFLYNLDSSIPESISNIVTRLLNTEPALRPTIGEIYETFVKFSSKKQTKGIKPKISLPNFTFIDVNEILSRLDVNNTSGETFIICGDKGLGKTRILNELRYRYFLAGDDVIIILDKTRKIFSRVSECIGYSIKELESKDKYTVFEEITELLKKNSKPLIIMVDNLDKFDKFDHDFFRYLGHSICGSKITLIATSLNSTAIEKMNFKIIRLKHFNKNEIKKLIHTSFTNFIEPQELVDWLSDVSGGNPLFIEEILRLLFRKNLLYYKENKWCVDNSFKKIAYPRNVEDIIFSKITGLDSLAFKILQTFILCDNPIEPYFIIKIFGDESIAKLDFLNQLGLIRLSQLNKRIAYTITSRIISDIADKKINSKERYLLSKRCYTTLKKYFSEQPEYYPHIAKCATACNEIYDAYKYSLRAAENEENAYNLKRSLEFFKKAIYYAKSFDPAKVSKLWFNIGKIEHKLGYINEAIVACKNALECAKEFEKSEILYYLGLAHQTKGIHNKAIEYFYKAIELQQEKNIKYVNIMNSLCYSLISLYKYSDAKSLLKESLIVAGSLNSQELQANVLYLFALLEWYRQNYDRAIEITKEILEMITGTKELKQANVYYAFLGALFQQKGDFKEAEEISVYALQLSVSAKDVNSLITNLVNLALIKKQQMKYNKAIQLFSSAFDYANKIGDEKKCAIILGNMANIYEIKGDFNKAMNYNIKASKLSPTETMVIYNIAMLHFKKGELDSAKKSLNDILKISDDCLYYFGQAIINSYFNKITEAEKNLDTGFQILTSKIDLFKRLECDLKTVEVYYTLRKYNKCNEYATKVLKSFPVCSREYLMISAIQNLSKFIINNQAETNISAVLTKLKKFDCLFDWAYLKRLEFSALFEKYGDDALLDIISELSEVEEIFKNVGAKIELDSIHKMKDFALLNIKEQFLKKTISQEYLQIFYALSDVVNKYLGEDNFIEKILDILIASTNAERGAFFFIDGYRLKLVAIRNIDKITIKDARELSRSIIREVRKRGKIICCTDALTDEYFRNTKSIILNNIRSLLCVPLKSGSNIIGAFYLDSRKKVRLFSKDDRKFLIAVSNFIATVIEKSALFQKLKEECIFLKMGILHRSAEEYLIGESPAIKEIRKTIEKIARIDSTVLITGETGCGKGVVARLIHQKSQRKNGKFISVNCGGVPETLFESELFGYKKGAFTGAHNDKQGLFEAASGGTLFLDEISGMPLSTQGKLLDVIETKKIRRLGEIKERKVDIRLISATNRNLKQMMAQGSFRDDLFYRISVLTIYIPPLRERTSDIPILADYFLKKYATEMNRNILGYSKGALKLLLTYSWPGNVRELQNAIERAVILAPNKYLQPEDFKLNSEKSRFFRKKILKDEIMNTLRTTKGNISLAAKILCITRRTLYRYLKKYNINPHKYQ